MWIIPAVLRTGGLWPGAVRTHAPLPDPLPEGERELIHAPLPDPLPEGERGSARGRGRSWAFPPPARGPPPETPPCARWGRPACPVAAAEPPSAPRVRPDPRPAPGAP